jgi:DNA-binding LytR/AlgR family response regulator
MRLKCIAIDDEPLALDIIRDYIQRVPFLEFVKQFENALDAINFLKGDDIDLIFLDIQMEDLTGIQMLKLMPVRPQVIFTTAYSSYALQGYELDVTDYLLKPISFERFLQASNKAFDRKQMQTAQQGSEPDEMLIHNPHNQFFFIKTEYRLQKVNYSDILYIEGQGDYLKIITLKENIMTLQTFKRIEEILPEEQFVRIHRSYIISINMIDHIERNRVKIGGELLPVSDSYKDAFFELLGKKGIV